ncbi:MAG TPA: hypothetical protein VEC13_03385 [Candidatus Paceibacterota bacterium]|nr:hypothetical protein [Candidatus Paceibacterota bacterium]
MDQSVNVMRPSSKPNGQADGKLLRKFGAWRKVTPQKPPVKPKSAYGPAVVIGNALK